MEESKGKLLLRELEAGDEDAFFAGLRAWDGEALARHTFEWKPGMSFPELLERQRKTREGIDLREGWVPASMFYGFVGPDIVGRVSVRHRLPEGFEQRGGHLGYAVAPRFRRLGYATEMARQALLKCRDLGLRGLLVTCDEGNEASRKIIESVGGKLENTVWDGETKAAVRRYRIFL